MACRASQTASIRFLGGSGLTGGSVGRRYQDHVLNTLTAAQEPAHDVQPAGQAKRQVADSASTIDRAVSTISRATTYRDLTNAVTSARRALDRARRVSNDGNRKELLALECKVEALERDGKAKAQRLDVAEAPPGLRQPMSIDPLSRSMLGVTAVRITTTRAGHQPEQAKATAPPESAGVARTELDALRAGQGGNMELGDFSEAVVAGLTVLARDHNILQQHNPKDSSHGLDIQSVDSTGKIWAFEVKGTRAAGKRPTGKRYPVVGRQGSAKHVADRSRSAPVVADSAAQVGVDNHQIGSLLVGVNLTDNEVTIWDLDPDGTRGKVPLETYALDDVVHIIDES
jgi:hypothetical protein